MSVLLNDNFEGGVFQYHTTQKPTDVHLNKGDILVFPSYYLHRVKPVISGERFVYIQWLTYRFSNIDAWRSLKSSLQLYDLLATRIGVGDFNNSSTQPTHEDLVNNFKYNITKKSNGEPGGIEDTYQWMMSVLNAIRSVKLQAIKRLEYGD